MLIREGERCPVFYAPAYIDFYRDFMVAYPFPLNLVVRYSRDLWYWLNRLEGRHIRLKKNPCYQMGLEDGKKVT